MTAWDELKPVITRLLGQQPGVFASYPSLDSGDDRMPPFRFRLAPWAAATAEELHRQFGDDVELRVGFLPYPPGQPGRRRSRDAPGPPPALLDPTQATVTLDEPAVVRSGNALHHHLTVRNLAGGELQIATNGGVTATVVDPRTGEGVGGYSGAQTLPLKVFRLAAGEGARIPLLTGTASHVPRLGYAIPAGQWGIQVTLTLGPHPRDSPRRRTPVLPLTITG